MVKAEDVHETGVYRCHCGADFDDLELGREGKSFMAIIGAPYMRIRCGKCWFVADPAIGKEGAIAKWNETITKFAKDAAHARS